MSKKLATANGTCPKNFQKFEESAGFPVTVTVTDALVLRPLSDRWRITESARILMPVARIEQKCFSARRNEPVEPLASERAVPLSKVGRLPCYFTH